MVKCIGIGTAVERGDKTPFWEAMGWSQQADSKSSGIGYLNDSKSSGNEDCYTVTRKENACVLQNDHNGTRYTATFTECGEDDEAGETLQTWNGCPAQRGSSKSKGIGRLGPILSEHTSGDKYDIELW